MTTEQLTTLISATSIRWNDILFAQKNQMTDNIPNLADLKATYARRNGENWIPNFTYRAGELVSDKNNLYVSLVQNNVGSYPPENPSKWLSISTNSLISGNFFVGAFCNFTITSNQIIIENNFNIDSILNNSSFAFNTLNYAGLNLTVRLSESSNITGNNYLVMTNVSKVTNVTDTTDGFRLTSWNVRARDLMPYSREEKKFKLGGIYERDVRYSLAIIPGIQASTN